MSTPNFATTFEQLTGHRPFPWMQRLYDDWFARGEVPALCSIPTGLGKTSVVAIWLIALANYPDKMPRRLVYVVNRRTVVDQTTTEVERLRLRLDKADLDQRLRQLCAIPLATNEPPLAISTLRGQFADNREWSADPCRPAVIVGTVDMIGSRLLFSGYGVGFKLRPLHAGLLGQDVLLVHDEAHLEPAFQQLIETIQTEQNCRERSGQLPWRKLRVMALTATGRYSSNGTDRILELTQEERQAPQMIPDSSTEPLHTVWKRIHAVKRLHLHSIDDEKKQLADKLAELALEFKSSNLAIVIFAQTVENVQKIVEKLRKAKQQVQQLTGTMRGLERDKLPQDPIFARFLPAGSRPQDVTPAQGTVYLVCTSAGEVGVNISADHLVCDLTTFESMAQRFGRVNRFGERTDTEIHVVYPNEFDQKKPNERNRKKTLDLLQQQLKDSANSAALAQLDPQACQEAFAPPPKILPATGILFDSWTLTTYRGTLPGRPPVEPYLHGIAEWQPPETYLAWRHEVEVITGELLEHYQPEDLLDDYPLKPHELLRDLSSRIFKYLKEMLEKWTQRRATAATEPPSTRLPVWIVKDDGTVHVSDLQKLIEAGEEEIYNRTLLLPPSAGGLQNGLLDSDSAQADDVSEQWYDENRNLQRLRVWDNDPDFDGKTRGMRLIRVIDIRPDADEQEEEQTPTPRYWYWCVRPRVWDDDPSRSALQPVRWDDHTEQVTVFVRRIAEKLGLPDDLKQALELAARCHDLGKKRELWQYSIGNPNPTDWHAKGGKDWKPREINERYRHEFGSLIDVDSVCEVRQLTAEMKELILHLIAAHHGRARPHFPAEEAVDPERPAEDAARVAAEVPLRFARLQRRYGRWGLAYLESLLRAADYAASANPSLSGSRT